MVLSFSCLCLVGLIWLVFVWGFLFVYLCLYLRGCIFVLFCFFFLCLILLKQDLF